MSVEKVSIVGLSNTQVLAALYNAARPQGFGFMQYTPEAMTAEEAQVILGGSADHYFDYLKGRVMKVDLSDEDFNPASYDSDNGGGYGWCRH